MECSFVKSVNNWDDFGKKLQKSEKKRKLKNVIAKSGSVDFWHQESVRSYEK
jgi:hypothetical protein